MRLRTAIACAIAFMPPLLAGGLARAAEIACMKEQASSLPAPPAVKEVLNGRPTIRFLPPRPKGIVYLFHGSGGSETFATRIHSQRVLAKLIAAGYGYISAPSLDRTNVRRWDVSSLDPAANPDIAYLLSLHRTLIGHGEITAKTPVFTTGMSNGGGFSNVFAAAAKAQGLPVIAVADYMGPFPASMRTAASDPRKLTPTLLILSRNDGLVSTEQTSKVAAELIKGGAAIEMHINPERRVCAATFTLVPGLTGPQRDELVAKTLVDGGLIDGKGDRLIFRDKAVISREDMAELQKKLPDGSQARLIMDELLIAWAGHQMRSEYADRQVAFFDKALANSKPAGRK